MGILWFIFGLYGFMYGFRLIEICIFWLKKRCGTSESSPMIRKQSTVEIHRYISPWYRMLLHWKYPVNFMLAVQRWSIATTIGVSQDWASNNNPLIVVNHPFLGVPYNHEQQQDLLSTAVEGSTTPLIIGFTRFSAETSDWVPAAGYSNSLEIRWCWI